LNSLLSERELEVLKMLAEGDVRKEIAKQLNNGYTTVDTHVSRLYLKLNVKNAPAAVNKAHLMKLFPPEP
jgi:DNA-binding NarL/FixJ family response regulator